MPPRPPLLLCAIAMMIGLVAGATASEAASILPGVYRLSNHPDGAALPPPYGLRLDELKNVTGGHDIFTFDFEHADSNMRLSYDGSSIHIFGTAYGGRDVGAAYDANHVGLWNIDFTYAAPSVVGVPGDDDLYVPHGYNHTNEGTVTMISGAWGGDPLPSAIDLIDQSDGSFTFRLGDENNDLGHRGYPGISGWGWMNHSGQPHVYSSDWLFTAQAVPEPSSLLLLGTGVGALATRAGRKRRSAR